MTWWLYIFCFNPQNLKYSISWHEPGTARSKARSRSEGLFSANWWWRAGAQPESWEQYSYWTCRVNDVCMILIEKSMAMQHLAWGPASFMSSSCLSDQFPLSSSAATTAHELSWVMRVRRMSCGNFWLVTAMTLDKFCWRKYVIPVCFWKNYKSKMPIKCFNQHVWNRTPLRPISHVSPGKPETIPMVEKQESKPSQWTAWSETSEGQCYRFTRCLSGNTCNANGVSHYLTSEIDFENWVVKMLWWWFLLGVPPPTTRSHSRQGPTTCQVYNHGPFLEIWAHGL